MQTIKYSSLILLTWLFLPNFLFAINHPPEFIPPLTRGVAVGDTLIFTLTASDPDGDAITWSAESLPPGALFNASNQTFFWIPANVGTFKITFAVDDGYGYIIRKAVEVTSVNKGEWFTIRTAEIKGGIGKIFFVNDSTGWALGGEYGSIVHTVDGGTTWISQKGKDTLYTFLDLWFTDQKNGWVIGYRGTIFHTNDGGITWNKQSSGTNAFIQNVQFVDSATGWINAAIAILSTSDGGKTWNMNRPDNYWDISSFYFLNHLLGWATGYGGIILHTEDGGITWSQQTSGSTDDLEKIQFIDSSQGWAVGKNGTILFTRNGGNTWARQNSGISKTFHNVHFVNDKVGWAMAIDGHMLNTIDGGNTWSIQLNKVTDGFFVNSSTGWIVGFFGAILKTTDGGNTWANQISTPSDRLSGVNFIDDQNGFAVGYDGVVLHSKNGGIDWKQIPFDANKDLSGVQFIDSQTGWIIHGYRASSGSIFKTSDGGNTWIKQETHSTNAHLGIHFLNADTGWVVGDVGLLARTTDGGNTWINQWQGSDQAYFLDVYFANSQKGWVVASEEPHREILSTSDGGSTWTTLITQFSYLNAVSFADTLNGWVAGWGGTIGHTSDGGKTWIKQNTGISNALFDVQFVDPLTGWAVGDNGTIIQTKDGGDTWIAQPSGATGRLNKVYFPDPTTGFAVGEYGTILKLRRDDDHLIKQDTPYQTTIPSQASPVLFSFSECGGLKIQFTEGDVAGKALSVTYTQNVPSVVPSSSHFDKPAYYVDVSTTAENYKTNLVFKYTDDLVLKQGIKEPELAAAYWDAKDSLWKSVPVSIDTAANTVTLTTDHLSLWALISNKENLITGIRNATDDNALPLTYALYQNYPNPFNPTTNIRFQTPNAGHISLKIYNILGQEVKTVLSKQLSAGVYEVLWDGTDNYRNKVASGIYLYRMETNKDFVQTRKMVFLK